jgi:hypothetical protein
MRTGGGKCAILTFPDTKQESGTAAEAEDLATIRLQVSNPGSDHVVATQVWHRRRHQIAEDRIHKRDERSEQTAA